MSTNRKGPATTGPLDLHELADELGEVGNDLAYAIEQLGSAGVAPPVDFAASATNVLRRALDEVAALVEQADALLPHAAPGHKPGRWPGGRSPSGHLPRPALPG